MMKFPQTKADVQSFLKEKQDKRRQEDHLYSFCLLFYLDEWNTFSYKNDLKWTTLYNEQVELFFSFFFWFSR